MHILFTKNPICFNWMQMNRTPKLSYKMKDAIYFLYLKYHVTTAMHMTCYSSFIKLQLRSVKIITQTHPIYLYMQRCAVRSLMRFQILDFSSCRVIQAIIHLGKSSFDESRVHVNWPILMGLLWFKHWIP